MVGDLGNLDTELVAVLHLQVVLQHDDLEVGVEAGHTVCRGEDVSAGDDDSTALMEVVLVPDGDQPRDLARLDRSTICTVLCVLYCSVYCTVVYCTVVCTIL